MKRRTFIQTLVITSLGLNWSGKPKMHKKKIRFGLVADTHYADRDPVRNRFYRQSLERMKIFIDKMNKEKVDFILHLGDFKDEDIHKREEDTLRYLQELEKVYTGFRGSKYHCIGNHDVDSIRKNQFLEHITNTAIPKDKSYYSFDKNNCHFIVLDANYDEKGKDHFFKEGGDWQDANIPEEQLIWLQKDLENSNFPTVVFCHHLLFEFFKDGYKYHVNAFKNIQQILERSKKVIAVFQGHVHAEIFKEINGIYYVTQNAMVDFIGEENSCYSIVEIGPDDIRIKGYKRASDQYFHL